VGCAARAEYNFLSGLEAFIQIAILNTRYTNPFFPRAHRWKRKEKKAPDRIAPPRL
jgi:hypothetical protein